MQLVNTERLALIRVAQAAQETVEQAEHARRLAGMQVPVSDDCSCGACDLRRALRDPEVQRLVRRRVLK